MKCLFLTISIPASPGNDNTSSSNPFPPWLIGVIALSAVLVIGVTITIIQR